MRYFLTLAYHGGDYFGWQKQPNAISVQSILENALSTLLRQPIEAVGCGRTDTGVHAKHYVAHFDTDTPLPEKWLNSINGLLPPTIAVYGGKLVPQDAHARFDAYERGYEYHISTRKTPFTNGLEWYWPQALQMDMAKVFGVAHLLTQYSEFYPFCKSHSGVDHYRCALSEARWEVQEEQHKLVFHVSSNRFLRGMVRLIVGACVQVGLGQLDIEDVKTALDQQKQLKKSWSVPPEGLYLTKVLYPTI